MPSFRGSGWRAALALALAYAQFLNQEASAADAEDSCGHRPVRTKPPAGPPRLTYSCLVTTTKAVTKHAVSSKFYG
jgi:DNA polymerase-3 subunit delta'